MHHTYTCQDFSIPTDSIQQIFHISYQTYTCQYSGPNERVYKKDSYHILTFHEHSVPTGSIHQIFIHHAHTCHEYSVPTAQIHAFVDYLCTPLIYNTHHIYLSRTQPSHCACTTYIHQVYVYLSRIQRSQCASCATPLGVKSLSMMFLPSKGRLRFAPLLPGITNSCVRVRVSERERFGRRRISLQFPYLLK